MKFTPWTLNLTSDTHKCADLNLFRAPKPQAPASSLGSRGATSQQDRRRRGTVVLPILPGPKRRYAFFDVSVMMLSNVLYTPGAKYSELSWKTLMQQGFTRHVLHNDHMHDITHVTRSNTRSFADTTRTSRGILARPLADRHGRNSAGGRRFTDREMNGTSPDRCGRLDKEGSIIRHRGIPGVDLLWCCYDRWQAPGIISVQMFAVALVDMQLWSWGIEMGIVGKSASFRPPPEGVGWIQRYGGESAGEEVREGDVEDTFRKIVQGGLRAGEEFGLAQLGITEGGENVGRGRGRG